jgi:hypothetical protein
MPAVQHPNVSWVVCENPAPGVFRCVCQVCNAAMAANASGQAADQFARVHSAHQSASPTHYGLGDLVAKVTSAVGVKPCSPCEARRRQMNGWAPRVLPRR